MKLLNQKAAAMLAVGAVVTAGSVAAYAYFSSGGSGTASTDVGSAAAFTVTGPSGSGAPTSSGTMLPGSGSATVSFKVTNPSTGHQAVSGVSASILADTGGNILEGATAVTGCLASWFSAATPSLLASDGSTAITTFPYDLAGSGTFTGTTVVTMPNGLDALQDACQGHHPTVKVTVS